MFGGAFSALLVSSFLHVVTAGQTTICSNKIDSEFAIYHCGDDHECCPEGCCSQAFAIPKISIALGLNICTFIIILCFLCWCLQYLLTLFRHIGLLKPKTDDKPTLVLMGKDDEEAPPPSYSVAVNMSQVPSYEDAVSDKRLLR